MGSEGMNYGLTETQTMVRDLGRQIAGEKIKPVAAHYDETGEFPWEIVKILADADLMGVYIPEEYGGSADGTPVMNMCLLMEELSRACGGIALAFGGSGLGSRLVEECVRFARGRDYRRLVLWTNSVLQSARRIYEEQGFRLVEEEEHRSFGKSLVGQNWELEL